MKAIKNYILEEVMIFIIYLCLNRSYNICLKMAEDLCQVIVIDLTDSTNLMETTEPDSRKKCISKVKRSTGALVQYKNMIESIKEKYKEPLVYYLDLIEDLMVTINKYIRYGNMILEGE